MQVAEERGCGAPVGADEVGELAEAEDGALEALGDDHNGAAAKARQRDGGPAPHTARRGRRECGEEGRVTGSLASHTTQLSGGWRPGVPRDPLPPFAPAFPTLRWQRLRPSDKPRKKALSITKKNPGFRGFWETGVLTNLPPKKNTTTGAR